MVVGRGMIATKFLDVSDENTLFFASGVSNSNETDIESFKKEENLLKHYLEKNQNIKFIYFSSCDVENPQLNTKPYYKHKLNMEKIVSQYNGTYYILRLPQVVGKGGNQNTLINFLIDKIENELPFQVWAGTEKNILDIDDVFSIVMYVVNQKKYSNSICNIINKKYISILELVNIIETVLNKKAIYSLNELNTTYYYDSLCMDSILKDLNLQFNENYFYKLIAKYSTK